MITINEGDSFVCKEDVMMNDSLNDIRYQAGLIYISEHDGCITNDLNHDKHRWSDQSKIVKHFKKL